MVNFRVEYLKKTEQIRTIMESMNLEFINCENLDKIENEIRNFIFKIPVMGSFNAGKSSMINAYLEKELLPVALNPETAIATELKYGDKKIKAHSIGDTEKVDIYPIESISEIDPSKYSFIEVFLDIPALENENYILVDMPGLDSGLNEHNKAIMNYLDNGSHYIILLDVEQGGLKADTLNFIEELESYQLKFGVLVSKSDKRTPAQTEEVIQNIKDTLELRGYNDIFVGAISSIYEDGLDDLNALLSSIDYEEIFRKQFNAKINNFLEESIKSLEIRISSLSLDDREVDEKISKLKKDEENLKKELIRKKKEIQYHLKHVVKNNMLEEIKRTLNENSSILARCAMNGNEEITRKVNELLRPVMVNTLKKELKIVYIDLAETINIEEFDPEGFGDGVKKGVDGVKVTLETAKNSIEKIREITKNTKKFEKIYRGASTVLAVTTSVVAPWLEVIIIFLPDILKFLGIGTEESQRKKIESEIKEKTIPEIILKFSDHLDMGLDEIAQELIEEKERELMDEQTLVINSYNGLMEDKKNNQMDLGNYKENLENGIANLKNFIVVEE